jgi:hypothetical protein
MQFIKLADRNLLKYIQESSGNHGVLAELGL